MPEPTPVPKENQPLYTASDLKEIVKALAEAIQATAPKSAAEMSGLSKEDQIRITSPGTPKDYRMIPGKSDTGSTFTMHVIEAMDKKKYPHGRVVALEGYKHPAGIYDFESNGGLVPNGFPIFKDPGDGTPVSHGQEIPRNLLSPKYLQWRWNNFWQKDLREIASGNGVRPHFCLEDGKDKGLHTPWIKGSNRSLTASYE